MVQQILYQTCPVCRQAAVSWQPGQASYQCSACGLTIEEQKLLFIKRGKFSVTSFGPGDFSLAEAALKNVTLSAEELKLILGNVYTDSQLAQLAAGDVSVLRPVQTILAEIILEQLREACFLQIRGIRRGLGPALTGESTYQPQQPTPVADIEWQDKGNLFCTTNRLVMPSNTFTFIRLGRKIATVQAFTDGVGLQLKKEETATYFVGCYPHEAAVVAAYALGNLPVKQTS